jgi:ATP-dependent DNA helicase Q4
LKEETSRRGLNKNGKKQQLLMRLAIWTRDELVKSSPELANAEVESESVTNSKIEIQEDEKSDTDSSSSSTSEDELELFDGDEGSEEEDNADTDDESVTYETSTSRNFSNDCLAEAKDNAVDTGSSLSASLKEIFGHNAFRNGQEWAIQRCLDEKSSLLVAPTGFGKSLCYALPAALMDGVCIVVSPLISLIQDQLRSLPPRIPAATLSGSVSASKTAAILDDIVRKRLKILFVSPERLTSPAFRRLFNLSWNPETKTRERKFPEISLLCIDEAHCISQWAHNFRPCFLRFKGFLKVMKPKSILAITATAGPRVIRDIGQTLGMDFPESITEDSPETSMDTEHEGLKIIRSGRDNIDVMGKFMSNQEERLATVAGILTPFGANSTDKKNPYARRLARGSVIVYVWRQRDTEVVAESLKAAGVAGGIVVYHGGMDANARAKSQSKFMRGKARICVATVAFGLGIDKADIVGVSTMKTNNKVKASCQMFLSHQDI